MRRRRRFLAGLCAALATAGALVGCTSGRPLPAVTPADPPPVPRMRPAVPAGFQGGVTVFETEAAASRFSGPSSYRVEAGDNLFRISQRFGLPVRSVIDANALTPPFTLRVGQTLTIPRARVHQVAAGDTVYGISRRHRVDMAELVRLNRIVPPYTITPGQRLVLPDPPGAASAAAAGVAEASVVEGARSGAAPLPARNPSRELAAAPPRPLADDEPVSRPPAPPTATASRPRASVPSPPPRQGSKFLWPVQGRIISGYGPKGGGLHNDGVNIAAARGTPVLAAENGVVAYAGNELRGFGNLLLIKHSDGWVTAYAHTEDLLVQRGQTVRRGQAIGRVGSSGNVSSPQLHFEIRKGTRAIDPTQVLAPRSTAQAG